MDVDWQGLCLRVFKSDETARVITVYCDKFGVKYERVCFKKLSPHVLDEADSTAAGVTITMRRQGFHFLLAASALRALKCLRPLSSR